MSKIVLNDVFSQWLNDKGIIKTLTDNYDVPWKNVVDGSILDLEYHGNRSGGKIIAPLVEKLITKDGISDENAIKLCGLIYSRNKTNWQKLWDTLSFEYNPLENYDRQELGDDLRTPNLTNTYTDKNPNANKSNIKNYKNGYNSTSQVMSDSSESTMGTDIETSNKSTGTENNHHDWHIHGNIGVTTSQQMLQSELDVAKNLVSDVIVDDFKNKFCIVVY